VLDFRCMCGCLRWSWGCVGVPTFGLVSCFCLQFVFSLPCGRLSRLFLWLTWCYPSVAPSWHVTLRGKCSVACGLWLMIGAVVQSGAIGWLDVLRPTSLRASRVSSRRACACAQARSSVRFCFQAWSGNQPEAFIVEQRRPPLVQLPHRGPTCDPPYITHHATPAGPPPTSCCLCDLLLLDT